MKVIDLLNKIANGEKPTYIKYDGNIYAYNEIDDFYQANDGRFEFPNLYLRELNEEVEIIEEEKKIPEKLNIELNSGDENKVNCYRATNLECDLAFKINSIIDYLQSKGE